MKYYNKNKRLFNLCILIIIFYFLNAYDILTGITHSSGTYFWQASRDTVGPLSNIIKSLNNFTYLGKGIIAGCIIYLSNAYRLISEKQNYYLFLPRKNNYLIIWLYNFKVVGFIMLIFIISFCLIAKIDFLSIKVLSLTLINLFLYIICLNEFGLILTRKIKWLTNIRYLTETVSIITILLEIILSSREICLFFNSTFENSVALIIIDLLLYIFLKKKDYFNKEYNCLYLTYGIK